jgi:hypothetical protein
MNGAHLVEEKDVWEKQELSIIEVWVFWTTKNIFDLCQKY